MMANLCRSSKVGSFLFLSGPVSPWLAMLTPSYQPGFQREAGPDLMWSSCCLAGKRLLQWGVGGGTRGDYLFIGKEGWAGPNCCPTVQRSMRNNIVPCHTKGPRFIQLGPDLGISNLSQLFIQSILHHSNSIQSGVWSSTSFALLLHVIRAFYKLLKEDLCNSQLVFNGLLIASLFHSLSSGSM